MEFLDDDLGLFDIFENRIPRRKYERANYIEDMDNLTFFKRFRLLKETVISILPLIDNELAMDEGRLSPSNLLKFLDIPTDLLFFRNNTVSPINQLLTKLRFYATGGHLSSIADFMGTGTSTVSKIVKRTCHVLAMLKPIYIKMPETQAEKIRIQHDFFVISSFPKVIGCIDGTHIRIQSPGGEDGEIFRNRKGYFSLNVQFITDSNFKVMDVVARWPGSQHDNTIFNHNQIKARLENQEFPNCVLLGDSGYAIQNYLLTPLAAPMTRGERLYNEAHIRTRNSIEGTNGVIKRRFPVLAYGIRLKLETYSFSVIAATVVLHNIARHMNEPDPPPDPDMDLEELNYLIEPGNIPEQINNEGMPENRFIFRNEIVNYFENLPQ